MDGMSAAELAVANEVPIRLACFVGVLVLMAAWERALPRRRLGQRRAVRWTGNLGLVVAGWALVRLVFPMAPVGTALAGERLGLGLFNLVDLPFPLEVLASVVVLDLAIYGQHVMFHLVPPLWRLHRVHHADTDFDVTTGARFHPLEIALSLVIKMGVVVFIGAPALAVLVFEVVLSATSLFNHGNVRLAPGADRLIRRFLVTPDMHRVHHSVVRRETDSNFGFNLACWDRLFGTYRAQPEAGHEGMTIGTEAFREPRELRLDRLLVQPFLSAPGRGLRES
jgi:sterol desaturase/sphingolipid hydroxylase (fatty acid hydroxylase superfamily)